MNFIKQIERIQKADRLISHQRTGVPEEFAQKLNLSRAQLYRLIEQMKLFGAPIKYSRTNEYFYYSEEFEMKINFSLKVLSENEETVIYGGCNNLINNTYLVISNNLQAFYSFA